MARGRQQGQRQAQQTAASNNQAPALAVTKVTPPPKKGRKGSVAFPEESVKALADFIRDGAWGGDGQEYEKRQHANTRVTRLKRALIHFGHYSKADEIKSRVWETEDGKFRLALTDAEAAKKSD